MRQIRMGLIFITASSGSLDGLPTQIRTSPDANIVEEASGCVNPK
jgi:hypothetical protein